MVVLTGRTTGRDTGAGALDVDVGAGTTELVGRATSFAW
jgi:hypothetical protein